jgi:KDO2-lipid IV(A) lauroyltransferase
MKIIPPRPPLKKGGWGDLEGIFRVKRLVWFLEAGLFIFLSIPFAIFPLRLSLKIGEILGILLFYAWESRRRIAIENIEKSAISYQLSALSLAKETFKNLGRSFVEVIKIYYGLGKKVINSVEIDGIENFDKAKSKGKGVLFITGHCGNWELLAIATSKRLPGTSVVARPINNPYINNYIESVRQKHGNSVIYKKGALKEIIKTLHSNGSVGILLDQAVLPDEGFVIDFLGRGAWTTKMPALIARKTGASVLPAFIHRVGKGHKIKIHPEIRLTDIEDKDMAVLEDTKRFSGFIEDYIKEHPAEWLWIHRRWKRVD